MPPCNRKLPAISLRSPSDPTPTSLPPPSHLRLISVSSPRHPRAASSEHVLNGIAHDEQGDRLFVTGKCWPNIFQVSVHSPTGAWPEASEFVSPPLDGGEIARRPLQGFQGFQGRTAAERAAQRAARSAE